MPDVVSVVERVDGAGESAASGNRTFSLSVFLRYKWTVLLVTVLTAPLLVAGVWFALQPEYRARSLVHVRSKLHHLIEPPENGQAGPWGQYDRYLMSQVQIIKSSAVLERLKDRPEVRATDWYNEAPSLVEQLRGSSTDPYARLNDEVTAEPVRKTELIEISMATSNPRDAAAIVNALVAEYVSFVGDEFSEEDRKLLQELQEDERELTSAIAFSERAASEVRRKLGTGSSADDLILQQRVRLDQLQGELAELDLQVRVRQQELEDLQTATAPEEAEEDAALTYLDDGEWQKRKAALKAAEQRLASASEQFAKRHPIRIRLENEVEFARQQLADREREIDQMLAAGLPLGDSAADGSGAMGVAALKQEIRRLETRRTLVQQTIDRMAQEYAADFEAAETLRSESAKIDRLTTRLQQIHQRQRELLEKGRVPPAIKVIATAAPATQPDNASKRMKMSLAALFGALALGLGAGYVRFLLDPNVAEPADVQRAIQGPFLGYLPLVPESGRARVTLNAGQVEAIRIVRTALLTRLNDADGGIVQITSTSQGSGKSTASILLARSLAQLGKRVLLVDADVRRPSLARHFELESSKGLLDLLRNNANGDSIHETELPLLSVLPAGEAGGLDDFELLANGRFSALMRQWRDEYDITIVDGPPLWGTADAAILARKVDGTILVVREGHCRRNMLASGLAMFETAGGRLLGTVFVGTRPSTYYAYPAYGYGMRESPVSIQVDPARDRLPPARANDTMRDESTSG